MRIIADCVKNGAGHRRLGHAELRFDGRKCAALGQEGESANVRSHGSRDGASKMAYRSRRWNEQWCQHGENGGTPEEGF